MIILDSLAPIFLLVALGALLQAHKFWDLSFLDHANRLTYWIALPSFLFYSVATAPLTAAGAGHMLGLLVSVTGLIILMAFALARFIGVAPESTGTFIQGSFRANLAYVGLPILYAIPDVSPAATTARTAALLSMAPMMILYNLVSVFALVASQHRLSWRIIIPALRELSMNPLLIALLAGSACAAARFHLPVWLEHSVQAVGLLASPLALLCIGGALVTTSYRGFMTAVFSAALLKTFVAPALGWSLGHLMGVDGPALRAATILLATPTAAASFTLTNKLGGDGAIASGTIALSTLMSAVSLALIVWFL